MFIERLTVEDGFLDGLELNFSPGFNVIIGPRGTGKTSILELIRFSTGAKAYTKRVKETSAQHALSILGFGKVTLVLNVDGERKILSTTGSEEGKQTEVVRPRPIVLAQNEIEAVGLDPDGRLRILDGFAPNANDYAESETFSATDIRSVMTEIEGVREEITKFDEELQALPAAEEQLKALETEQSKFAVSSVGWQKSSLILERLSKDLSLLTARKAILGRSFASVQRWYTRIKEVLATPPDLEEWPTEQTSENPLEESRNLLAESEREIFRALQSVEKVKLEIERLTGENAERMLALENQARTLRKQLEEYQSGAGVLSRKISDAKARIQQLSALKALRSKKLKQLKILREQRSDFLNHLDSIRGHRYLARTKAAAELNRELGPAIRIDVERAGNLFEYSSALVAVLRGSTLHHGSLAPLIASRMSPREVVEAVEQENFEIFSETCGLTKARAERLVSHLRNASLAEILTVPLEDSVTFHLLDGAEYKPTEQLSTGQRCTVILPIILEQSMQPLLIDQPEDHLDNAFIVQTLIKAILKRKPKGQMIFATHNANIPVLGDADTVFSLGSDGQRGFLRCSGDLSNNEIVRTITSVMEGGYEAFNRRAEFYKTIKK